jgi:hypothetical protein
VFSGISALGGSPIGQGIVFFAVVFGLTLFRVKVFKADIGITFATLAAVYAVDDSFRGGNLYGVDTDALKDLLKSWAFGAAISLVRVCALCNAVIDNTADQPDGEFPRTPRQGVLTRSKSYLQDSPTNPINHRLVASGGGSDWEWGRGSVHPGDRPTNPARPRRYVDCSPGGAELGVWLVCIRSRPEKRDLGLGTSITAESSERCPGWTVCRGSTR